MGYMAFDTHVSFIFHYNSIYYNKFSAQITTYVIYVRNAIVKYNEVHNGKT